MRKAIKLCLALAMVGTMASQAFADTSVGGNAWFGISSHSDDTVDTSANTKTERIVLTIILIIRLRNRKMTFVIYTVLEENINLNC